MSSEPSDRSIMRSMSNAVQRSSDASIAAQKYAIPKPEEEFKYSNLRHFGETIVIRNSNIEKLRNAINSSPIPNECKTAINGKLEEGNEFVRHHPSHVVYDATEDGNGGVGYKYDLYVQWLNEKWHMILVVAGSQFSLESDVQYLPEEEPMVMALKKKGWLGEYVEEQVEWKKTYKRVVKPKGITSDEFKGIIADAYQQQYVTSAQPTLKGITDE